MKESLFNSFSKELKFKKLLLNRGDILFNQGSQVINMYQIHSGRLKLIRDTVDGNAVVLHVGNAGDTIAEASLFSTHYHCSAIVDATTEVDCVNKNEILSFLDSNPVEMKHLLLILAKQVRGLRAVNEIKNIRSAQERILAYIQYSVDEDGIFPLDVSLKDISQKIGLAHETFYRELKKLEDKNLIIRNSNEIKLV